MSDYYLPSSPILFHDMTAPRPSNVRVLAKSLHLIAVGWLVSVAWLWIAQIQLHVRRFDTPPDGYAVQTLIEGLLPAALIEIMALWVVSMIARVPGPGDPKREWQHAFWWTVVPNLLVLGTAYLLIFEGN